MRTLPLMLAVTSLGWLLLRGGAGYSQVEGDMGMTAQVSPAMTLRVDGGTNAIGRRTVFSGAAIPFGGIIFTQPELIGNGDAFLDQAGRLHIEATIEVSVVAGGIQRIGVDLSRLPASPNPFAQFVYSLGLRREDPTQPLPVLPESIRVKEFQQGGGTVPVRIIGIIDPSQSGSFSETMRIHAQSIL